MSKNNKTALHSVPYSNVNNEIEKVCAREKCCIVARKKYKCLRSRMRPGLFFIGDKTLSCIVPVDQWDGDTGIPKLVEEHAKENPGGVRLGRVAWMVPPSYRPDRKGACTKAGKPALPPSYRPDRKGACTKAGKPALPPSYRPDRKGACTEAGKPARPPRKRRGASKPDGGWLDGDDVKQCRRCLEVKPWGRFSMRRYPDGSFHPVPYCKECACELARMLKSKKNCHATQA